MAPLYNLLFNLHFSRGKFCPTLFESTIKQKPGLIIEDLRHYRTNEILNFSDAQVIVKELAIFHALGFLLKKSSQHPECRIDLVVKRIGAFSYTRTAGAEIC